MGKLFYQIEDQIYFDQKAFLIWAKQLRLVDPNRPNDVQIEWIDRSGLLHVN